MALTRHIKRVGIGIAGGIVLIIGIIAIPYPGPGWLIVFAGLAILSTEFAWAGRLLAFARHKYDAWQAWLMRQSRWVQLAVLCFTGVVIATTIWLLNGFGIINNLLQLNQDWVVSPLFRG